MKNLKFLLIITLSHFLISSSIFGQSPEKMSYQAVVRDASNNLVTNSIVGLQISILQGSATGTVVYMETQTATANSNGLVTIEIGGGTVVIGDFSSIDWANGSYYILSETDPTGGSNYTISGSSQLLSVPYALHAKTAENILELNAADKKGNGNGNGNNGNGNGHFTNADEIDPIFTASVAAGITSADTAYWNNHTIDTDTHIDSTGIANLGYIAGPLPIITGPTGPTGSQGPQGIQGVAGNDGAVGATGAQGLQGIAGNDGAVGATGSQGLQGIQGIVGSNGATGPQGIQGFVGPAGNDGMPGTTGAQGQQGVQGNTGQQGVVGPTGAQGPTGTAANSSAIYDADNDTKIQVEESADEDVIRFDIAGIEKMVLTSKALEFRSNNYSVFIGEGAGNSITTGIGNTANGYASLHANTTGHYNTANGSWTLSSNITGTRNIAIGSYALQYNTTGHDNTANGYAALQYNTTGFNNTAFGMSSLRSNTTGFNNTANGFAALHSITTGNNNTAYGYKSLQLKTTGDNNVAIGTQAGYYSTTGGGNIFLGYKAGYNETSSNKLYIENSSSASPLIYGDFSTNLLRINGTLDINNAYQLPSTDGATGQVLATNGSGTLNWTANNTDETDPVYATSTAGGITSTDVTNWNNKLDIYTETDPAFTNWDKSTGISITESQITDLDHFTNADETDPVYAISIASGITGTDVSNWNNKLDTEVDGSVSNEIQSLSISGNTITLSDGGSVNLPAIGGINDLSDGKTNSTSVFLGSGAGASNTAGNNTAIGINSLNSNTTGSSNTAISNASLKSNTTGSSNTANGLYSLYSNTTGSYNTATGRSSLESNTTGQSNTASGYYSLHSNTTGCYNTANGLYSLESNTTGSWNTANGNRSLYSNTTGHWNTANGHHSLYSNTTGNHNTGIGNSAGYSNQTGSANVFLGYSAGYSETGSNKLYIENSNSITPLIYGDFSTDLLRINGTLDINNAYQLPTTDGTTGQVLATNGSGTLNWTTAIGPTGPQGIQGVAGNDGAVGATGPQGIQGVAGNDGAVGATGAQGLQGLAGNDGAVGATGQQGPAGSDGMPGNDGAVGATGSQGPQGITGNDGAVGAIGPQGR